MEIVADLKQKTDAIFENLNPIQHLENLSFPRRAGTDGEIKAAQYIKDTLEGLGYRPTLTEFHYSKPKLRSKIIRPLVFFIWLILGLVNIHYWDQNWLVALIVLALPLLFIGMLFNMGPVLRYFFKKRVADLKKREAENQAGTLKLDEVITSRNVMAEIGEDEAAQYILFTAHFDSISVKMPRQLSTVAMLGWFFGFLILSVLYLSNLLSGNNFLDDYFTLVVIFALILAVLQGVLAVGRSLRSNESHGVIDDGTGVAILLELAKFLKENPQADTKFIFGFFGSEEVGWVGSSYDYIQRDIDNSKMRVITVDMIGEKKPLAYIKKISLLRNAHMEPIFNEEIVTIADALGIEIVGKNFLYPGSDFASYMLYGGCQTNWLLNMSRYIHSKDDHMGNVDTELVRDALKLIVAYFVQKQDAQ